MTRSKWKFPYIHKNIYRTKKRIFSRQQEILPIMKNNIYYVHNGIIFMKLVVRKELFQYKIGSFIFTRKKTIYLNKRHSKKKNG